MPSKTSAPVTVTEDPPVVQDAPPAALVPAPAPVILPVLSPAQEAVLARWVTYVLPDGPHTGELRPAITVTTGPNDRATLAVFTDPTDAPYQGHPYALGVCAKVRVAYDETGETLNTWH